MYINLLDLRPLAPYEQYMRSTGAGVAAPSSGFGAGAGADGEQTGGAREKQTRGGALASRFEQRATQTGESNVHEDVQCEPIELESRWTQAPAFDDRSPGCGSTNY